jgi:hypothetical protein
MTDYNIAKNEKQKLENKIDDSFLNIGIELKEDGVDGYIIEVRCQEDRVAEIVRENICNYSTFVNIILDELPRPHS